MRAREVAIAAVLFAAGCGQEEPPAPPPAAPPSTAPGPTTPTASVPPAAPAEDDHDHSPKHGGSLLEVGEHDAHLEVVHDPATGTLTAWVYDADMKPLAVEAPVINLTKGPVQVPMTAVGGSAGRADAWKVTHGGLQGDPVEGRVRLKIGDKTFQVALEE